MEILRGVPASEGVARGPWVRLEPATAPAGRTIEPAEADAELTRLAAASARAAAELDVLAERLTEAGHPGEGAIFGAQATMARDPALAALAEETVRGRDMDAVGAVLDAGAVLAGRLRDIADELLAARAADVLDVAGRIARRAAGLPDPGEPALPRPSVVVAQDLAPSVAATLPRGCLLGFALETGSPTAHAALLARAYGIPAVVGVSGLLAALARPEFATAELAVDGGSGDVVIAPDAVAAADLDRRVHAARDAEAAARVEAALPAATRDGVEIALLANIGTPEQAPHALELGARGAGLFRTEFLFLERPAAPTEEEQVRAYRSAVESFAPHPVTLRLLDVGGDKPIPYVRIAPEANPFLGVRALRLAAEAPGLFLAQLRAAMRAAVAGPLKVMAPMVADAGDAATLLELADRARADLVARGDAFAPVALGVMLEIPSAILVGDSYFSRLSFASLGTNDLLQYTLASDRGNAALRRYQDPMHPALLRLVREAVERAAAACIELSVCGEMAGDPAAALALVGLGIRQLSMAAGSLAAVRRAIRAVTAQAVREEAERALGDASAAEARDRFTRLLAAAASP
jgi:phosphoenolpyruvate-protein phosphotransferase